MSTAVIVPARNEEMFLSGTLSHLLRQTTKPKKVIVINDGSKDKTRNVALGFKEVEVIDVIRDNYEYAVHTPILAQIVNQGLKKVLTDNFEYVMIIGSDHLIPPYYLSTIIEIMKNDNKIAICSGQIKGEHSVVPRGSGRVVQYDFWKKIGLLYPENYGCETYLLIKAAMMGYKVKILNELVTTTQRKTGKYYGRNTFRSKGKAIKALGYSHLYSTIKIALVTLKNPPAGISMIQGYLSSDVIPYDQDLRNYLKRIQHRRIKKYIINPLQFFNTDKRKGLEEENG